MAKRGLSRDYRVEYRYERTRVGYDYDRNEPIYEDRAITGTNVHDTEWVALEEAAALRGRGATATVVHVDPVTKVRTIIAERES